MRHGMSEPPLSMETVPIWDSPHSFASEASAQSASGFSCLSLDSERPHHGLP